MGFFKFFVIQAFTDDFQYLKVILLSFGKGANHSIFLVQSRRPCRIIVNGWSCIYWSVYLIAINNNSQVWISLFVSVTFLILWPQADLKCDQFWEMMVILTISSRSIDKSTYFWYFIRNPSIIQLKKFSEVNIQFMHSLQTPKTVDAWTSFLLQTLI